MRIVCTSLLLGLSLTAFAAAAEPPPIEQFLKDPTFTRMKISPDGKHLAATVPQGDDKSILVVLDRASMKPTALLQMRNGEFIGDFFWANDQRLIASAARKQGVLDQPVPTGELYGVNANGKSAGVLFGYRADVITDQGGSRLKQRKAEAASGFLIDTLPDRPKEVLIEVQPWGTEDELSEARLMNIENGKTRQVARAPLPRGSFMTDRQGNLRLCFGTTAELMQKIYVRPSEGGDWVLMHDETKAGYQIRPLAFEADGQQVLVSRERAAGANAVYRWNLATNEQVQVLEPGVANPGALLSGIDHGSVYALVNEPGKPEIVYLDGKSREAKLNRALSAAFPGQIAYVTSFTRDGKYGLVHVYSDRNPGEFYFFDLATMHADFIGGAREWIDPEQMAEMRPITLKARDGTPLYGYLVLPKGKEAKNLPLVVNPHGGPHGIRDSWGFDEEAQLLASRGYAVLKLNFRGSGGYGSHYQSAGYKQWGRLMQDDLADGVRWTIAQGLVDAKRICTYGASYGGYTALMNVARYPELYRCAVGYVGVYDLALMYKKGDVQESRFGNNYLDLVIGRERLDEDSPVHQAAKIKVPVMLVVGGEDVRVPPAHGEHMRAALTKAGNPPEWIYEAREGHGFFNQASSVRLYTGLLAFLDRNIGSSKDKLAEAGH